MTDRPKWGAAVEPVAAGRFPTARPPTPVTDRRYPAMQTQTPVTGRRHSAQPDLPVAPVSDWHCPVIRLSAIAGHRPTPPAVQIQTPVTDRRHSAQAGATGLPAEKLQRRAQKRDCGGDRIPHRVFFAP